MDSRRKRRSPLALTFPTILDSKIITSARLRKSNGCSMFLLSRTKRVIPRLPIGLLVTLGAQEKAL